MNTMHSNVFVFTPLNQKEKDVSAIFQASLHRKTKFQKFRHLYSHGTPILVSVLFKDSETLHRCNHLQTLRNRSQFWLPVQVGPRSTTEICFLTADDSPKRPRSKWHRHPNICSLQSRRINTKTGRDSSAHVLAVSVLCCYQVQF